MAMNRLQFQPGLSLPTFLAQFGTEAQCAAALELARWPQGFRCPGGGQAGHNRPQGGPHKVFQCHHCRRQTALAAGTLFQSTHRAVTVGCLAIDLIGQAKTGRSAWSLKRRLGVSDPTAWRLQQTLMPTLVERDARYQLGGDVQVDDADLGGELTGGTAGLGSENKVPWVAAVSVSAEGHPQYVKLAPVPGFTRQAIADWARADLRPGCCVNSDGLGCFVGVTDAGCRHQPVIVGGRKPRDLPEFSWINTVLGHRKTSLGGAYPAFRLLVWPGSRPAVMVWRGRTAASLLPLSLGRPDLCSPRPGASQEMTGAGSNPCQLTSSALQTSPPMRLSSQESPPLASVWR